MKNTKKLFSLFALSLVCAFASFGQTAMTQTTLASAVNGPAVYNGPATPAFDTCVTLASVTGVVAPFNSSVVQSVLYIGTEAIGVITVNTTSKVVCGIRGYSSTTAAPHPSGDMVLIGQINSIGTNFFLEKDPPLNGGCTAASTPGTPWLNKYTGAQWLCSTITLTWVPGWNNPWYPASAKVTTAVASAAGTVTPSGPLFHITGALAITGFNIPVGFNATASGGGTFCAIPDGTFTTTNAGNIALGSTAVVNKILCWTWDATNQKFVPSY